VDESPLAICADRRANLSTLNRLGRLALPSIALATRLLQVDAAIADGTLHEVERAPVRDGLELLIVAQCDHDGARSWASCRSAAPCAVPIVKTSSMMNGSRLVSRSRSWLHS
jgi:hypothetical protein